MVELLANGVKASGDVVCAKEVEILLRKVERRFGIHPQIGHSRNDRMDVARELADQALRCRARGRRRRGVDQIGDAFRLREVELAVQKCAFGEFARFGESRA